MIILKYTESQYMEKITELEGYHSRLSEHLTRMEELRDQISSFWDDDNAKKAYMALVKECTNVRYAMEMTNNVLMIYKKVVSDMSSADAALDSLLEEAISAITTFGA